VNLPALKGGGSDVRQWFVAGSTPVSNNVKFEFRFRTISLINPQPEIKDQHPILIGIIIAVLLIELMGKPICLKWTGGLQCIKLFS
jgi:hypothetical protein